MKNIHSISYILILLFFVSSCAPKILSFNAIPRNICAGQETTISWKVRGVGLLTADTTTNNTGPVPDQGSAGFAPTKNTVFTITAMRSGKDPAYAEQEVLVFKSGEQRKLVFMTEPLGTNRLVATKTLKAEVWNDVLRIDTISGLSDRPLHLVHEGKEATLSADGTETGAFKGSRLSGKWDIYTDLIAGEVIGEPANAPPDRLRILVTLKCVDSEE